MKRKMSETSVEEKRYQLSRHIRALSSTPTPTSAVYPPGVEGVHGIILLAIIRIILLAINAIKFECVDSPR